MSSNFKFKLFVGTAYHLGHKTSFNINIYLSLRLKGIEL